MNKRIVALVVLLAVMLAAAAVLVVSTRYREPRGAAAGSASGCGGEAVDEDEGDADVPEEDAAGVADSPAQIIYVRYAGGKACEHLVIEPLDNVASVEDKCGGTEVKVYDLDDETSAQVLAAYSTLKEEECTDADCPPESRIEVLTVDEKTRYLPYSQPLKEHVEKVLSLHDQEAGAPEQAAQEQDNSVQVPPPSHQMKLTPESGAVFATLQVVKAASPLNTDLICYPSSKTVDLQPGAAPTMADQKHLKLFRTPGGTVQKFGSLSEVPAEPPAETDRDMVHHAQAGMGFSVENNVSSGYSVAFVKDAADDYVLIEFLVFP